MSDLKAGQQTISFLEEAWNTARSNWNDSQATAFHDSCIYELRIRLEQIDRRVRDMDQECQTAQMHVRQIVG